jgi:hypothetical protein
MKLHHPPTGVDVEVADEVIIDALLAQKRRLEKALRTVLPTFGEHSEGRRVILAALEEGEPSDG